MKNQASHKFCISAAALLAISVFPTLMCAQSATTTNSVKKPAATRGNTVTSQANPAIAQAPAPTNSAPATTDVGADAGQQLPTANIPAQATQTAASNTPVNTTTADPTSQVQNGINQVNEKKQKAKSIWNQIKNI